MKPETHIVTYHDAVPISDCPLGVYLAVTSCAGSTSASCSQDERPEVGSMYRVVQI
jgi:hypothetical protein